MAGHHRPSARGEPRTRVDTLVHGITYLRGQGAIVDFYRRLQQHQNQVDAVQEAQAHGRKPPTFLDNPIQLAYDRATEAYKKAHPNG